MYESLWRQRKVSESLREADAIFLEFCVQITFRFERANFAEIFSLTLRNFESASGELRRSQVSQLLFHWPYHLSASSQSFADAVENFIFSLFARERAVSLCALLEMESWEIPTIFFQIELYWSTPIFTDQIILSRPNLSQLEVAFDYSNLIFLLCRMHAHNRIT